jgi:methylmalonyl-CoA/ethylmalonyl-CoA epimerase
LQIEHIGIAVSSLEEAVRTWRGLGLAITRFEDVAADGVRVAMIPMGDSRIELLESTTPDSPIAKFLAKRGPGIHHIAIRVDNIDQTLDRLRASGARIVDPSPRQGSGGTRVAFLHPASLGGVLVELVEHEAE